MKKYLSFFKLHFITGLQYRASALAGMSTQLFFGLIYVMVYIAFFESNNSSSTPMTLNQTISYLWLNQIFFALIIQFYKDRDIFDVIKSGNISYELIRPQNIYFMWYFKILGKRVAMVVLRCLPILLMTFLLPIPYNLSLPSSFLNLILSIISLIIGALLVNALITLYPVITVKTLNEKGVVGIFIAIADLLSGLVVPIPYFPAFLKTISAYLPFQYISDLPFRIYVGNLNLKSSLNGIIIQFIWIFILIIIGYFLLKRFLHKVEVQGG